MIITQTPLRLSFCGGGSDFEDFYKEHGGAVLSTTINKYVFVMVKERIDDKIYLHYSKNEIAESVDDIQHDLIREAMRMTGVDKGVEISTFVDVWEGTGLGSSSAITVGLLNALWNYRGIVNDRETLARKACEIEINILGRPIGVQDQYIASYGGLCYMTFDSEGVRVERLDIDFDKRERFFERLLLYSIGSTRLASDILTEQKANIDKQTLSLKYMADLADKALIAMYYRDWESFACALNDNWSMKKGLSSNISNDMIDELYEKALLAGAMAGKVVGAGGGGFLLLFCENGEKDGVRQAMREIDLKEVPFAYEPHGSKVIFDYRR